MKNSEMPKIGEKFEPFCSTGYEHEVVAVEKGWITLKNCKTGINHDWSSTKFFTNFVPVNRGEVDDSKYLHISETAEVSSEAIKQLSDEKIYETGRAIGFTEHARLSDEENRKLRDKLDLIKSLINGDEPNLILLKINAVLNQG